MRKDFSYSNSTKYHVSRALESAKARRCKVDVDFSFEKTSREVLKVFLSQSTPDLESSLTLLNFTKDLLSETDSSLKVNIFNYKDFWNKKFIEKNRENCSTDNINLEAIKYKNARKKEFDKILRKAPEERTDKEMMELILLRLDQGDIKVNGIPGEFLEKFKKAEEDFTAKTGAKHTVSKAKEPERKIRQYNWGFTTN